ncbi:hypothetical protein P4A57_005675, partial [Escherichia coli]|nr:hypothetical protein [Escherichia coli]
GVVGHLRVHVGDREGACLQPVKGDGAPVTVVTVRDTEPGGDGIQQLPQPGGAEFRQDGTAARGDDLCATADGGQRHHAVRVRCGDCACQLLCGAGGGQRLPDVGGDGHGDTAASGDALGYLPQADIPAGVDDDGAARQALVCGADADRGGVDPLSRGLRDHR